MVGEGAQQVAGRYTLVREVGRGGMGAVWLARDELLDRNVAVKKLGLFPGAESPDLARAEREATLAARLSHPNVVTVFDLAADGDARWLVMEYVEGQTLAHLAADRGGLPADEAAAVIRQAAEALAVAHEAGIVHRDVKPSNLIVGPDGTTKLTDFGIARGVSDAALTQTGLLTGSPAYLAPEVAGGRSATTASDIWSLGATLYQALTGRPPYDLGENLVAGLSRIVREPPPRLPDAGPLATLLEATMTHDPERRWTAAQVSAFLDDAEVGPTKVMAPPLPAPDQGPGQGPTSTLESLPLPPPPPPPPPAPPRGATPAGARRQARSARPSVGLLWPIAAVLLVVVLGLGAWLLGRSQSTPDADPTRQAAPAPTSGTPTTQAPAGPTAEGMATFVNDYLATVTRDPAAGWAMLTPQFQEESGGFDDYRQFWAPIRGATASEIEADPEALTVSYRVDYDGPNNRPNQDRTRLRLVYESGRYLIAGESG